jgi:hypothetical protein
VDKKPASRFSEYQSTDTAKSCLDDAKLQRRCGIEHLEGTGRTDGRIPEVRCISLFLRHNNQKRTYRI